jgi:hypothetical protein
LETRDLPKLVIEGRVAIPNRPDVIISWDQTEIPRDVMDAYELVAKDGKAKVQVGNEISMKDYGTGFSAYASVTLSCGQDDATIQQAASLASNLALHYAREHKVRIEKEFDAMFKARNGPQY